MGQGLLVRKRTSRLFVTGFGEIEKPAKNRFVKPMETVRRPPESRICLTERDEIDDG
jgi:hypothetical protein